MTRRCLEVLRICKGSHRGPEYLNSLVFELTLNNFQYQTPSISKVTDETPPYPPHSALWASRKPPQVEFWIRHCRVIVTSNKLNFLECRDRPLTEIKNKKVHFHICCVVLVIYIHVLLYTLS